MQLALRASHTSQKVAHLSQKMWPSHGSQAGHHQKLSEVVPAHTAVFSRVNRLTRTPESFTEPEKEGVSQDMHGTAEPASMGSLIR